MKVKRTLYATIGVGVIGAVAWFTVLEPRPVRLVMTARAGDDTVVVNQIHPTHLNASLLDQYHRRIVVDTSVRYRWLSGDSINVSSDGRLQCEKPGNATVLATFGKLSREFALRCRPVAWVEASSWMDLVVGDSTRDLAFVARDVDGRPVTELRGSVTVTNRSVVAVEGTTIRPQRAGMSAVIIKVGDAKATVPIVVYQPITSFVDNPHSPQFMALHVRLAKGDTMEMPLPKAAFWVTYLSKEPHAAPPTIELRGEGTCTLGNGLTARRLEDGQYAKYCYSGPSTRMMIAHGVDGADVVSGVVALRMMW